MSCHSYRVTTLGVPFKNLPMRFNAGQAPLHGMLICLEHSLDANSNSDRSWARKLTLATMAR